MVLSHDSDFRDQSGFDQQKLNVRHEYIGEGVDVTTTAAFNNLNQETASYIAGLSNYKDNVVIKSNPNPKAFRGIQSARFSLHIKWH